MDWKKRAALAAIVALAGGCNSLGIGTRVTDLGNGRYRIVTSQAEDVATKNAAAARDQCPGGYTLLQKGATAEAAYGSLIEGNNLGTYWLIKCAGK